jgi:hypothetical protein
MKAPLIAASLLGKNALIIIVSIIGTIFRVVIARGNVGWVGIAVPIYVSTKLGRVLIRWRRRMGDVVVLDDFVLRLVWRGIPHDRRYHAAATTITAGCFFAFRRELCIAA